MPLYPSDSQKMTAKGILLPSEWDENGDAIALTLFTHDEDEYRVEGDAISPQLFDALRQELLVEGRFRWERGRKIIRITGYRRSETL